MKIRTVNIFIIAFVAMMICGCYMNSLELSFNSAIGKYKSNYKHGNEFLELRSDSTYSYKLEAANGEIYSYEGKWRGPENDSFAVIPRMVITFYDWPINHDPVWAGIKENSDTPPIDSTKGIYDMVFTEAVIVLKQTCVLRRDYDRQEEFDFIKEPDKIE